MIAFNLKEKSTLTSRFLFKFNVALIQNEKIFYHSPKANVNPPPRLN
jgi:hypothetical protein